ncbi:MAG: hypothetical protein HC822_25005 [Oscillochloris sp.]|nr:hypothetical protein [Oscillochloris sp.]
MTVTSLIAAKLTPPPLRPGLIARATLSMRLNQAAARVIVVVAPPGFGKTSLLAAWASMRRRPTAWLNLDERDNDPARWMLHLVAAYDRVAAGVADHALAMLQSPTPAAPAVALGALIGELQTLDQIPALVCDDYHVIDNPAVHELVSQLIDQLPATTQVVIAGRSEPPLPLGRLRMRDELLELRVNDLRFGEHEVRALLQGQGLKLNPDDLDALTKRTEGWVGALHLAALTLRESRDSSAQIAALSGDNRYLVDYLAEEVVQRQEADLRAFLLASALPDQVCAGLCVAIGAAADEGSAALMLERIERAGLFLLPLDQERRWFRYHGLFAEFLRNRLLRQAGVSLPEVHRRAADWYAAMHLPDDAVRHLLAGGEIAAAAAMIERHGRELLLRGEVSTVRSWLQALPDTVRRERPALGLITAWAAAVAGHFEQIATALHDVETVLDRYSGDPDLPAEFSTPFTPRNLRSETLAIRATVAGLRREIAPAIALGRQALEALPDDSVIVRGVVQLMFGTAAYQAGDLGTAVPALEAAAQAGEAAALPLIAIFALRQLGEAHSRAGQLHRAHATLERALALGARLYPQREHGPARPIPVAGIVYVPLGMLAYEWNQLERAAQLLAAGMQLGRQGENVEILLMGPIGMAKLRAAQGDPEGARAEIRAALAHARATGVPRLGDWLAAEQARLHVMLGDLGAAAAWNQERRLDPNAPLNYLEEIDYLTLARLLIAQGKLAEAHGLLDRLRTLADAQGRLASQIEIDALSALASRAQSDGKNALHMLAIALEHAAPEGFVRLFIDLGEPMARLLAEFVAAAGPQAGYARRLLEAYNADAAVLPSAAPQPVRRAAVAALTEKPTARELEVLGWITTGLTNEQIAEKLFVGVSTVKKHINNLYAKLEVTTRTQAIRRARELGLIE